MARIVLFGATGYTGGLTARSLVEQGRAPVLAARTESRVKELAAELGGLDVAVADVARPETVAALVGPGDVLISTVGPFVSRGEPAVGAAVNAGAHYLDSTGEPPFIRRVIETWGPRALASGSGLLTAMGYDYVPGNLAGALALEDAGPSATAVRIGYFVKGATDGPRSARPAVSGGTLASMAGVLLEPGYVRRDGRLLTERPGVRTGSFRLGGRDRAGVSVGGSEHLTLPLSHPGLCDVDVYLGWFGQATTVLNALARTGGAAMSLTPVRRVVGAGLGRVLKGSTGGPDAEARAGTRTVVAAEALDERGRTRGRAVLEGVNPYDFTGAILAWAAGRIADGGLLGSGGLGPVDAFGLDALLAGCELAGLSRIE